MNRNSKKGFTIVELIIVIAVIAVLAAVLIPTFSNLIQKANEAKDTALVSNLNKAVAMDTSKNETVYDVLTTVRDNAGYDVGKINAAATNNEILWDSANNCFVYSVNGEIKYIPDSKTKDVAGDYDYWKLSSNQEDVKANKYSIYWTGAALSEITATTGFDAGEAEIGKIIYQREDNATAQTVTIRTNGGELEVSAKPDTVYHYDVASKVVVTKVHNASYHENGTVVGNLEVKEGHVELGAKADVSTVIVAPTTANAAKVTVTTGATVGVVAATTDEGKTYLDTATTVPSDKKAETKLDESVLSQFAGGIGTEASPYLIANLKQLRNLNTLGVSSAVYVKQVADIVVDGETAEYKNASGDYSVVYKFNGVYDGNGYSLTNMVKVTGATTWHSFIYYPYRNVEIKNLDVYLGTTWFNLISDSQYATSLTFENINFYNQKNTIFEVAGNNYGLLASYTMYTKVKVVNVNNYANINNNEYASGLFIGAWYLTKEITFENCNNYGNWNGSCGFFNGNISYFGKYKGSYDNLYVTNCHNYGTIVGAKVNLLGTAVSATVEKEVELKNSNNFNGMYTMDSTTGLLRKGDNSAIEITNVSGATKYVFSMYYHYTGENGINGGFVLSCEYTQAGATNYHAVKFIDSLTAVSTESLGLTNYKSGTKFHDNANNIDYYLTNGYYVFDNPLTIEGDKMVMNGNPRCTLMVYNGDQLIAYEIVNADKILSK